MTDPGNLDARFEQALAALVLEDGAPAKLMGMSDHSAVVVFADRSYALLFRYIPGIDEGLGQHLRKVTAGLKAGRLFLVLIGGGEDQQALLSRAQVGWGINRKVGAIQWKADGDIWIGPRTDASHTLVAALERAKDTPPPGDPAGLHADLQSAADPNADGSRDLAAFAQKLKQTRPQATWAMVGVCGLMYALASIWGGADYMPTLFRTGANLGRQVADGEWYRLAASVFLHGGLAHLLMNMLGVWFLGGFLERLLGSARLLILLCASGLAGSLASAMLSPDQVSVGASGALMGLFGATVVMAFIPVIKLPVPLVLQLRRNAVVILVINAAISMLPRIDLWAHLGGGLMGAALMATRLLSHGRDLEAMGELTDPSTPTPRPRWLAPAAAALAVVMLAGLVQAQVEGRPWDLVQEPALERLSIEPPGASVEIPAAMADQVESERDAGHHLTAVGEPYRDPLLLLIDIQPSAADPADPEAFQASLDELLAQRANEPVAPELQRIGKARIREIGGVQTIEEVIEAKSYGLRIWRFSQLRPGWKVTTRIEHLKSAPRAWKGVVERIVGSVQTPD